MRRVTLVALALFLVFLAAGCALFTNRLPIARFTTAPLDGVSPLEITFDAAGSYDPDGRITSYSWDFGDGASGTGRSPEHTFVAAVTHTFSVVLTVTDDDGATAIAAQSIEVRAASSSGGNAPSARFTATPSYGDSPLTVAFDASLSSDPDGVIRVYAWDFGDGSTGSGKQISHTFNALVTTNYTVTLAVIDDDGETGSTTAIVTAVVSQDVPSDGPTASFTASAPVKIYASPSLPSTPSLFEVTFDPSASTAAPGGHHIDTYLWDFGDGESATSTTDDPLKHTYASGAPSHTYVVTLTVVDEQGLVDSTVRNVTVTN